MVVDCFVSAGRLSYFAIRFALAIAKCGHCAIGSQRHWRLC